MKSPLSDWRSWLPQWLIAAVCVQILSPAAWGDPLTPVGVARVDVSPTRPVPLMGYAARAKLPPPAEVAQRIYARALAIGSDEEAALVLTLDNCILPSAVTEEVRRRVGEKGGIRPDRIALSVTHTHSAPCLTSAAPNIFGSEIAPADQAAIDEYTQFVIDRLEEVALAALADRKPAEISWGQGNVGFAKNRRTPGGPVDHHLPLMRITSADGNVRAVFINYACHCTTLSGEFNAVHGDWAGVAAETIEREHPGAVALVAIGCGADANPEPRGTVELAVQHGETVARETDRLLGSKLTPIHGTPECKLKTIQLPFQTHFTREEWTGRAASPGIVGYHARKWLARLDGGEQLPATLPYPVQTWNFGDQLALVFLGGEVVVDYSTRLKREFDAQRLWLNAYSNAVPCYIPSRRILAEGGYEAESSLWYYDQPQRLAPEAEDLIVQTVHELLPESFKAPAANAVPPPRSAAEELESFRHRANLEVQLVASEPLIESPVAIDFGADGRLWVCEMRDYPSGMDGNGKHGGRIKVLTDTDQDGRYDTAEIWADDLPYPTGIMAWRNGVIVCAAPDVWFLSPEGKGSVASGEPVAGNSISHVPTRREKLLSGFGIDNFQARVNGLRWGLDGWVHGSGGLFGGKITVAKTGKVIDCTNRDFRFRPDTGEFEPLAGVSQQGHVRDDFDQWFGNDNSTLLWHFPMPDRYRRRNPHVAMPGARVAPSRDAEPARVFPTSQTLERFNHPESANRITSGCGPEIYRDSLLGAEFAGNAFACESVHNLIRRAVLTADGATFTSRRAAGEEQSEFFSSTDHWFRPVEARTGPDGALWVVDMYRFVIEHPRWIPAERLKELDVRAGADKGRIWRIVPAGTKATATRDLTKLSPAELAATIDSENGPVRDLAHRLLLQLPAGKFSTDALPELVRIASKSTRPASQVEALAILKATGQLSDALIATALSYPDPRVRRAGIVMCEPQTKGAPAPAALPALVNDPDPAVRYQLALTLGEFPGDEAAGVALGELAVADGASEWHRAAVLSSMLASPRAFVRAFAKGAGHNATLDPIRGAVVTTLVSAAEIQGLRDWVEARFPSDTGQLSADASAEAMSLLSALSAKPEVQAGIENTATSLKNLREKLESSALKLVSDTKQPMTVRTAALRLLGEKARTDVSRRTELLSLFEQHLPEQLQQPLLEAVQRQDAEEIGTGLLKRWQERSPGQRLALLPLLLSRTVWTNALLAAVERGEVSSAELSSGQRQQLRTHPEPSTRTRAEKLFHPTVSDRAGVIRRFAGVGALKGNVLRGAEQFERLCASCHSLKGRGHAVGPDLTLYRAKSPEDFLVAILDPNAAIEPRYAMWTAELKDGRLLAGVSQDESATSLTLVQPGGLRTVAQREQIVRLSPMPVSLMPVGLEEGLEPQALADLIAWIKSVPGPFGGASSLQSREAREQFLANAPAPIAELISTQEPLHYPSWIGRLPLFYCRQTDGKSRVTWKTSPAVTESAQPSTFRFAAAMGHHSQTAGNFALLVNGEKQLTFDVALGDAIWTSEDSRVRVQYTVHESNNEDSCGLMEVKLHPSLVKPGVPIIFEVSGGAANSQRWFGVYQLR